MDVGNKRISPVIPDEVLATLAGVGDPDAEPGSREWAVACRLRLQSELHTLRDEFTVAGWLVEGVETAIAAMQRHRGYATLLKEDGAPFASWRQFCETRQPFGLGYAPEAIAALLAEHQGTKEKAQAVATAAAPVGNPSGGAPFGNQNAKSKADNPDNVSVVSEPDPVVRNPHKAYGNSAQYRANRLARDHPEILERVRIGELPSVAAAERAAGVQRVSRQVWLSEDPAAAVAALARRFDRCYLMALATTLLASLQ